jgi:hypothetical protein
LLFLIEHGFSLTEASNNPLEAALNDATMAQGKLVTTGAKNRCTPQQAAVPADELALQVLIKPSLR